MSTELPALWAIVRKDLALSLRRPVMIAITLLPPLILLLVLVLQAAAVTAEPVAVVNDDPGGSAAAVLQRTVSGFDGFRTTVESAPAAARDYHDLRAAAILTIPAGFSADVAAGRRPAIGWRVRNFDADSTNDLQRGVGDVVSRFVATGVAGTDPLRVGVVETDLHKPDAGFVPFQLVAVLVLLLLQAGLINAGLAAALEWQTGSIKELLLAPASSLVLILGKVIAGVIAADAAGCLLVAVARVGGWLPGLGWSDAVAGLAIMTLLGLFGSAVGVALAARLRSVERINPISAVISFYLFFLAGGIAAVAYLPGWLRAIARVIPNTYAVHALRNALLYGTSSGLAADALALVLASLVMLAVAVPAMRRGLAH
jgi:ABC-2 type transport system permease protein